MINRNIMTSGEKIMTSDWVSAHLAGAQVPFSFIFGGRHSSDFIHTWQRQETTRQLTNQRMEHVIRFTDPASGLVVRCVAITYHDFPVVEWTLYFNNTGGANTPIIESIRALDWTIRNQPPSSCSASEFILNYHIGSPTKPEDYRPLSSVLKPNSNTRIATSGGRPSNAHLPYFNLEWAGGGTILAIGWPGQWATEFIRDPANQLQICAGQELTHFTLYPGEEVRTPLIALLFYQGDRIRSQNLWRRWMLAHNIPRPGGYLPTPLLFGGAWLYFAPWGTSNAQASKVFIDTYEAKKIPIDAWWIDAGWYVCDNTIPATGYSIWIDTGTWEADPRRFPNGLREVTDHAHKKGLKVIVWFEPERVMPGTWLATNHPEWLIRPTAQHPDKTWAWTSPDVQLLNFGNPEALEWVISHFDALLVREGVDIYREDQGIEPLYSWRDNDAPDRQGITEIKHVTGHLAYWDTLRQRHPDMLLDTCAGGGKRNDLESLRRAVPLWRTDYALGLGGEIAERINANQCITQGIASWIPYYGSGLTGADAYRFRSFMCPSMVFDFDPRRDDLDINLWQRLIHQFKQTAKYYFGDYYPLTSYSLKPDVWVAWQFDCPETGEGMIQVFRRENCMESSACFKLQGLQADAVYRVTDLDSEETQRLSGQTLMEKGVTVAINDKPSAIIKVYARERP